MSDERLKALETAVEDVRAQLMGLATEVEDVSAAVAVEQPGPAADGSRRGRYPSLRDWVVDYLAPTFSRQVGGEVRWCAQWEDHREAVLRLEALWSAWEALRLEGPLGMATWLTSFLDPQFAVLLGRGGPFAQCAPGRHTTAGGLVARPSPRPHAGTVAF